MSDDPSNDTGCVKALDLRLKSKRCQLLPDSGTCSQEWSPYFPVAPEGFSLHRVSRKRHQKPLPYRLSSRSLRSIRRDAYGHTSGYQEVGLHRLLSSSEGNSIILSVCGLVLTRFRAYYRLAKIHHPDTAGRQTDLGASQPVRSQERRFARLSEAYEVLSSPEKRARYDAGAYDTESSTGPDPTGRQQNYQRHTSDRQTSGQHGAKANERFGWYQNRLTRALIVVVIIGFEIWFGLILVDQPALSFERIWRDARASNDPAKLRRITFELAPLWMSGRAPTRRMVLVGALELPPSDPELAVEGRIWMRVPINSPTQDRSLVWIGIDMDSSEIGLTTRSLLQGLKPPKSAARFNSALERCQGAMDHLISSGRLKEEKTLTVIALRESYLLCEYNSRTGSFEICSCGEWITEVEGSLAWSEEQVQGSLSRSKKSPTFTGLWEKTESGKKYYTKG